MIAVAGIPGEGLGDARFAEPAAPLSAQGAKLERTAEAGQLGDDSNLTDTVLVMGQARLHSFGPDAELILRAARQLPSLESQPQQRCRFVLPNGRSVMRPCRLTRLRTS